MNQDELKARIEALTLTIANAREAAAYCDSSAQFRREMADVARLERELADLKSKLE